MRVCVVTAGRLIPPALHATVCLVVAPAAAGVLCRPGTARTACVLLASTHHRPPGQRSTGITRAHTRANCVRAACLNALPAPCTPPPAQPGPAQPPRTGCSSDNQNCDRNTKPSTTLAAALTVFGTSRDAGGMAAQLNWLCRTNLERQMWIKSYCTYNRSDALPSTGAALAAS